MICSSERYFCVDKTLMFVAKIDSHLRIGIYQLQAPYYVYNVVR